MDLSVIIIELVSKYPVLGSIVAVMGSARLILKPLMVFLKEAVLATPSDKDDLVLNKVEASKIYKALVFLLDYLFSLKLKNK
jgi:hypothetical protein